ncbi:MFS transporter [Clostridium sp. BL-8]|uniref:MFS transporter n=1 Tax=Clostridium sp. BL-8 TaxID=349938 RepID=UPI00098C72E6|nr:MFS transporter [Clostridium sp. BL-8]OOM77970.1 enterobactin exporter EntS [Clostridium sp. BL-8]
MLETKIKFNKVTQNRDLLNMSLFSLASSISIFGTSAYNFAISLYVLKITNSGLNFATTLILGVLSVIAVTPFAGVLADKLNKKLISITADILNGFLLMFIYLLIRNGYTLDLKLIYISTFFLNFFSTIYGISIEAAKPNLVHENKLISLNSISKVIESSASISGPMVGGLFFAILNIKYFIFINSISFIISACLQLLIDFRLNYSEVSSNNKKLSFYADINDCFIYLNKREDIIKMTIIFVAINFFIGLSINIPMPYIINNIMQLNTKLYGLIQSTYSIGAILGAIIIKKIIKNFSLEKIIKSATILLSSCMIALGFSVIIQAKISDETFILIYFVLVTILIGFSISFIDIPIFYFLQKTISDEFRGRVLGLVISIAKIVLPIALIISGYLINQVPSYLLSIVGGILLFIFTLLFIKTI